MPGERELNGIVLGDVRKGLRSEGLWDWVISGSGDNLMSGYLNFFLCLVKK